MNSGTLKLKDLLNAKKNSFAQVQALEEESKIALGLRRTFEDVQFKPNETVFIPDTTSLKSPMVQELIKKVKEWINIELMNQQIVVTDLFDDIKDGLILHKLRINQPETDTGDDIVYSISRQISRIQEVFNSLTYSFPDFSVFLRKHSYITAKSINQGHHAAILKLLIFIINSSDSSYLLPENVTLIMLACNVENKKYKQFSFALTDPCKLDCIDHLEPDHHIVKNILKFVNSSLIAVGIETHSLSKDNGVNLIKLLGFLGNFFVPYYYYSENPQNSEDYRKNIQLVEVLLDGAFEIVLNPVDQLAILNGEPKTTQRILFQLYKKCSADYPYSNSEL